MKKLLLLLLDSLNSGSNKNLADLDEDEKWLARKYFPMLITESESSPDHLLESVAEVAQVVGTRAMRRVLHFCDIRVRVDLLMTFFRCLPTEVYSNESILPLVAPVQQDDSIPSILMCVAQS